MRIRNRLILSFVVLVGIGFYFLTGYILDYLRPRYLESVEDVLVDQANILAAFLEGELHGKNISTDHFKEVFDRVYRRSFTARIYKLSKTYVDERIYITDANGKVIFDSNGGTDEGKDYSQWRNISLTLQGKYGARTSKLDSNPQASLLHITAPILSNGEIVGTLTVSKPTGNINFFMQNAKPKIVIAGSVAALSVILLGIAFSTWLTWPLRRLTYYAEAVRDGKRAALPKLGRSEISEMGKAFEEMREALDGKKYVENYVQTLTHELKSPIAAIQGAAEILEEDISEEKKRQFLRNIQMETQRMRQLVERMLTLSSLEARQGLENVEEIDVSGLLDEIIKRSQSLMDKKNLRIEKPKTPPLKIKSEKFLIEQSLSNLIQNAIDFSPVGGKIRIEAVPQENEIRVSLKDEGPGIPDYALPRVFEKFYSLPRPDTGKKSSGLGLSFVKEAIELHGGKIQIGNNPTSGIEVKLILPQG